MMGRAGRPQFDDQGVAVILVHDVKKHFYKKFLYEPFPVESRLVNAESTLTLCTLDVRSLHCNMDSLTLCSTCKYTVFWGSPSPNEVFV